MIAKINIILKAFIDFESEKIIQSSSLMKNGTLNNKFQLINIFTGVHSRAVFMNGDNL